MEDRLTTSSTVGLAKLAHSSSDDIILSQVTVFCN